MQKGKAGMAIIGFIFNKFFMRNKTEQYIAWLLFIAAVINMSLISVDESVYF